MPKLEDWCMTLEITRKGVKIPFMSDKINCTKGKEFEVGQQGTDMEEAPVVVRTGSIEIQVNGPKGSVIRIIKECGLCDGKTCTRFNL